MHLKNTFIILFSLTIIQHGLSQSIRNPTIPASLYNHLYEVNKEWGKQMPPNELLKEVHFSSDVDRIQTHLSLVEKTLRQRTKKQDWSNQQLESRLTLLDTLQAYSKAARFPRNTKHQSRQPYFIDDIGTACAVGYLMLATGETETVENIHQNDNYAYIQELFKYDEIHQWAATNGFTIDELAWIQPGYAVVYFTPYPFRNDLGSEGEILSLEVKNDILYMAGDFTDVDGFSANCLVAWNGVEFEKFPGINGRAEHVAITENGVIYLSGLLDMGASFPPVYLARYENNEWQAILTSNNCDGVISDLVCTEEHCFISGHFQTIRDSSIDYFAQYSFEEDTFSSWQGFSFSGPIFDLNLVGDTLLLAGAFTLYQNGSADSLAQFITGFNLNNSDWLSWSFNLIPNDTIQSALFIGGRRVGDNFYLKTVLKHTNKFTIGYNPPGENFFHLSELPQTTVESNFRGIHDKSGFIYGQITLYQDIDFAFFFSPGESASPFFPIVRANDLVTALTYYEGQLFIVGAFTEIDGIAINGITQADLLISDTDDLTTKKPPVLHSDGQQFFIKGLKLHQEFSLSLFDQTGRAIWEKTFIANSEMITFIPPHIIAGTYVYRLLFEESVAVGQVLIVK